MLYDKYKLKMEKVSAVLSGIKRRRVLIITLAAVIFALLTGFLSVKGVIYSSAEIPSQFTYGEDVPYSASALFGRVAYEYAAEDSEDWTAVKPLRAGSYKVRGVSKNIFGAQYYTDAQVYSILPKPIKVAVSANTVQYGENPELAAELMYNDVISCSFNYEDPTKEKTQVTPAAESIVITDKNGGDVTASYIISVSASEIEFTKRAVSVTTGSAVKTYDGSPLTHDGCGVSGGTLAEGDSLSAVFSGSLTEAGETENTAELKITNAAGADVTARYDIQIITGRLVVERLPLHVLTQGAEKVYDGTPLSNADYDLSPSTPPVTGHTIELIKAAALTDVGTCENLLEFKVTDAGRDVTANYSFTLSQSELKVAKLNLTVQTDGATKTYDGAPLTCGGYSVVSVAKPLAGHGLTLLFSGTQTLAGTGPNTAAATVTAGGRDVTLNYGFEYICGGLVVTPRPISVITDSGSLYFNGKDQSLSGHTVVGGVVEGHSTRAVESTLTKLNTVEPLGGGYRPHSNIFEIKVFSGTEDYTYNYDITGYVYGTVTMLPAFVTVTTANRNFVYNGAAQSDASCTASWLADGHVARIREGTAPAPALTEVVREQDGSLRKYLNIFEVAIYSGSTDVSYCYTVNLEYGTIKMEPRPVTVTTYTNEWGYDGEAHSESGCAANAGGLVAGHTVSANPETLINITNVVRLSDGTVISRANVFSAVISDGVYDVTHNYFINYVYGSVKITPRKITVTTGTSGREYNGTEYYDDGHSVPPGSLIGMQFTVANADTLTKITNVLRLGNGAVGSVQNKFEVYVLSGAENVTYNYDITYIYGALTITPRAITVKTASNSWVYDGEVHYDDGCDIPPGDLVSWQNAMVASVTTITNAGSKENVLVIEIYASGNGEYLTYNYNITYISGTLTVTRRPITVLAGSPSKEYDGWPLSTYDGSYYYIISELGIVNGQYAMVSFSGFQTDIGSSENKITSFRIYFGDEETTSNYNITLIDGTITITPRYISVIAGSASKIWDGEALTCSDYSIYGGALLEGHSLFAVTEGSQTEVGWSDNIIAEGSVTVSAGIKDVSEYYEIRLLIGTLQVGHYKITVKTGSAEKAYNGDDTPLTCDLYEIEGLPDGFTAGVLVYGSIYWIGKVENKAIVEWVNDDAENPVADNFIIEYDFGTLTITGNAGNINLDGSIDRKGSGGDTGADNIIFIATSEVSGAVYFRIKSFGDYNANGWVNAKAYSGGGINALSLTALALNQAGKQSSSILIEPLSANLSYMLPYYALDGYLSSDDTMINAVHNYTYWFNYIPYVYNPADKLSVNSTGYEAFEAAYYAYVLQNYLQLPDATRAKLLEVAAKNNLSASKATVISDVASFVQNAVKYDLNYEEYLGDIAVYFFTQAKTGICQHYATAATAMLRALGIPARYVVGFTGEMMAGQAVEVSAAQAHAWVEVYLPGAGWVQIEVTGQGDGSGAGGGGNGSGGSGGGSGSQSGAVILNIKPIDVYKVYDGTPLFAGSKVEGDDLDSVVLLAELLAAGYRYYVSVYGSRTEYGVSESRIQTFILYDAYGRNVTDEYTIEYKPGRIRITYSPIYISLFRLQKYYDGTPLSYGGNEYKVETELPEGLYLNFVLSGSLTDAGILKVSELEKLPYSVTDVYGNDYTDKYSLIFLGEPLRVDRRAIEITSVSITKTYDGTPLTGSLTWISKGFFPEDYRYEALVTGTLTEVGRTYNTINRITVYDGNNRNVTKNFSIKMLYGTLTVKE